MQCMCVYCQRTVKMIENSVENKQKSSHNTKADILFVDQHNRLCCGRCISEHDLIIKYEGEAVITHYPKKNTYAINTKAVAKAHKEPVAIDVYEPLREAEL